MKKKEDKLKTFKVWTHIDSGILQTVMAQDEESALEKAKGVHMSHEDFLKQLNDNAQFGESNIKE